MIKKIDTCGECGLEPTILKFDDDRTIKNICCPAHLLNYDSIEKWNAAQFVIRTRRINVLANNLMTHAYDDNPHDYEKPNVTITCAKEMIAAQDKDTMARWEDR